MRSQPDPLHKGFIALGENGEYQNVKVDVIFPVLHGKNGEDGTIQGLFQLAEIPFVGCDCISSANCMDKGLTHTVLDANGIKTAKWVGIITSELSHLDKSVTKWKASLAIPCSSSLQTAVLLWAFQKLKTETSLNLLSSLHLLMTARSL